MPPFDAANPLIPKPRQKDPSFINTVFEELQIAYPKDPMRFSIIHNRLLNDAEDTRQKNEDRSQNAQNLCLLDLAVADLKAKGGNRFSAKVLYDEGSQFLNQVNASQTKDELTNIKNNVEKKI